MAIQAVLLKKTGNSTKQINLATTDNRITVTSDSSKLPANINTLEDLISALGSLAFEDYVALNVSDENNYGLVKISNTDSTDTDTVPSSSYIHTALSNKVGTAGNESITGVKNFTNGIQIAGQNITYDSSTDTFTYGTLSQS